MQEKSAAPATSSTSSDLSSIGLESHPGPSSATEVSKPNIFTRSFSDYSFLNDQPGAATAAPASTAQQSTDAPENNEAPEEQQAVDPSKVLTEILQEPTETSTDTAQTEKKTGFTNGLSTFIRKQIDGGRMSTYDDYDESKQTLDQYLQGLSQRDLEELLEANYTAKEKNLYEEINQRLYESLPAELQQAYQYVASGGTDLKGLFRSLSEVQQVRDLDVEKSEDQELIYRQYLSAINFGTPEEIDEEISTWKDLGQLDKKAKQAKPKLDKIKEQQVTRQLEQQETHRRQNEEAARTYVDNVYKALQGGEINGLKLDRKTQNFLYHSMVNAQYPSLTGKPTNLLGHLLEKYQFVEPNYALISEALWLLSDPTGYRNKLVEAGASQQAAKTVRALKSEESRKNGGQAQDLPDIVPSGPKKIARPGNIFRR